MNQIYLNFDNNFKYIESYIMINENTIHKDVLSYEQFPLFQSEDYLISKVSKLEIKINKNNNITQINDKEITFTTLFNQMID